MVFGLSKALRQGGDMGRADLATASDRFGTCRHPVLSERGIGRRPQVLTCAQKVSR